MSEGAVSYGVHLLSRLPPSALQIYHRKVVFRPTPLPTATTARTPFRVNLLAAAPTTATTSASTPSTVGLILAWVSQAWLVRGQDPLDPNAYSYMQSAQGLEGKFSMALAAGGRNVGQVSENLYSYGDTTYFEMPGWTTLNRNLLDWGGSDVSTVLYIPPDTKLEALFYRRPSAAWLHQPDAIEVELNGYTCPKSVMDTIVKQ